MNNLIKSIYFLFITLCLLNCTPKILNSIFLEKPSLDNFDNQLIIGKEDTLPSGAILVGNVKISDLGLSINCNLENVIMMVKEEARKIGGNIIQVVEHKLPNPLGSKCHRIKANIYYLEDISPYEKELIWSPQRRLTWNDFKGKPQAFPIADAVTASGFKIFSKLKKIDKKLVVQVQIIAEFNCLSSWSKSEQQTPELLKHEQGHFDITEIFARKLQQELNSHAFTLEQYNNKAENILRKIVKDMEMYQEQYDNDTMLSTAQKRQQEWAEKINNQLKNGK